MKMTKILIAKNIMLKCLAQLVLVLSIISFSGYVSAVRSEKATSPTTELKEVRSIHSTNTVYYKTVCSERNASLLNLADRIENFTPRLLHHANCIQVSFCNTLTAQPGKERAKGYLIYYATQRSEEFDTIQARG